MVEGCAVSPGGFKFTGWGAHNMNLIDFPWLECWSTAIIIIACNITLVGEDVIKHAKYWKKTELSLGLEVPQVFGLVQKTHNNGYFGRNFPLNNSGMQA